MEYQNSNLQFKYLSINVQNIDKPFFIINNLLSPNKKPSKDNVYPHFDITLAVNKNIFGNFSKETFLNVIKQVNSHFFLRAREKSDRRQEQHD